MHVCTCMCKHAHKWKRVARVDRDFCPEWTGISAARLWLDVIMHLFSSGPLRGRCLVKSTCDKTHLPYREAHLDPHSARPALSAPYRHSTGYTCQAKYALKAPALEKDDALRGRSCFDLSNYIFNQPFSQTFMKHVYKLLQNGSWCL